VEQTPDPWVTGWVAGAGVVAIAAGLLLEITARGNRIAAQARDITAALERTRDNAAPLFELSETSASLDRITHGLRAAREQAS
jgi:hypothetical protein